MSLAKTAARCLYPHHHGKDGGSSIVPVLALAAAAAAAYTAARDWAWIATLAAFTAGLVVVEAAVRFALLDPAARRYWAAARWHRFRWRRLAKNLRLAPVDR